MTAEPRIALVLSGGGARGAYEAGVLSYILDELPSRIGRRPRFSIVSGTSVGAIHACFLAARAGEPDLGARLARVWAGFDLESVYRVHLRDVLAVPLRVFGFGVRSHPEAGATVGAPERIPGLFDVAPLERLILDQIPWNRISQNVAAGDVDSVAIAATEIRSGRTVIFVENRAGKVERWARDPHVVAEAARLVPEHALASAAIPFFFPAIRIGPSFFCDGSLRLNTPLAPAVRLGADRVLVIGVHYARPRSEPPPVVPDEAIASPAFLAGKILNALLLDRVEYDADRLRLFNAILRQGTRVYGGDFLDRINEVIIRERGAPYRVVEDFFIQPSRDLGAIAAECVRHRKERGTRQSWSTRALLRFASRDVRSEADLLSYLYFDGCYASHLIELGRHDAERQHDLLVEFLR